MSEPNEAGPPPGGMDSPITRVRRLANATAVGKHVKLALVGPQLPRLAALCGPLQPWVTLPMPLSRAALTAELCFSTINFSFWGKGCYDRPGGSASSVRQDIFGAFGLTPYPDGVERTDTQSVADLKATIRRYADHIATTAIPLAKERATLLWEIPRAMDAVETLWNRILLEECEPHRETQLIYDAFPGFAADPFFKRGLLFTALIGRVYGRAHVMSDAIPLPADYQIPKVLRAAGILVYSEALSATIADGKPLAPGSEEEMEIRAASIVAVRLISHHLETTEAQIDDWLWAGRDRVPGNFHLTRTTWY